MVGGTEGAAEAEGRVFSLPLEADPDVLVSVEEKERCCMSTREVSKVWVTVVGFMLTVCIDWLVQYV